MKYGAIATTWLESLALRAGNVPLPMLDVLVAPLKARAIMSGVSLGIFNALRGGPLTAADLAGRLRLDPPALVLLLRVLAAFDYLSTTPRHGGAGDGNRAELAFALSPIARRTLVDSAPLPLAGYVAFNEVQWHFLEQLDTLVRSGRGIDFHEAMSEPEWAAYQRAMLEVARFAAATLAARVPVPAGARSLLDLGGAHGLLGAAICRRHPPLRSLVIELPDAILHARRLAISEGIADIVTHQAGDLRDGSWAWGHGDAGPAGDPRGEKADRGGADGHDVTLLANVLHHFTPEAIVEVLARVHSATAVGGTVAIWELEAPQPGAAVSIGDVPALYFRLTSSAGAYHGSEYAGWLAALGFERVRIARPVLSPGTVLVTGRRAGAGAGRSR